ncbi:MAG: SoxY-related AACIE arm protein [Lautropia sp.]
MQVGQEASVGAHPQGGAVPARVRRRGRRRLLAAGAGGAGLVVAATIGVRPVFAADLAQAVAAFTGGRAPRPGRVTLEIAQLVENGNVVPVAVAVDSPMTEADHVRSIALFTERNPQSEVARFDLGPRAGRARVATRMRLATSQQVLAVALMSDGSVWSHAVDVVVLLAACIE